MRAVVLLAAVSTLACSAADDDVTSVLVVGLRSAPVARSAASPQREPIVVISSAPPRLVGDARVAAQITAQVRAAAPAWNKGVQPISAESYYHAVECGKQGGDNPACVFWDTDMCRNDDFTLAWYTAYKQVAYEVWAAVRKKQPPPQPSYGAAQRTRVTIGITPVKGASNALSDFIVKRGGKPVMPMERSISGGGGRFTFDYPAFAPTAAVTLELVAKARTLTCTIPTAVLRQMR